MTMASPEAHKPKLRLRRGKTQDLLPAAPETAQEPAHYCEDLSDRISQRAHAFYVDRGYRTDVRYRIGSMRSGKFLAVNNLHECPRLTHPPHSSDFLVLCDTR